MSWKIICVLNLCSSTFITYHELAVCGAESKLCVIHNTSLGGVNGFPVNIKVCPFEWTSTGHAQRHRLLDEDALVLRVNIPQCLKIHGRQLVQHVAQLGLV